MLNEILFSTNDDILICSQSDWWLFGGLLASLSAVCIMYEMTEWTGWLLACLVRFKLRAGSENKSHQRHHHHQQQNDLTSTWRRINMYIEFSGEIMS